MDETTFQWLADCGGRATIFETKYGEVGKGTRGRFDTRVVIGKGKSGNTIRKEEGKEGSFVATVALAVEVVL